MKTIIRIVLFWLFTIAITASVKSQSFVEHYQQWVKTKSEVDSGAVDSLLMASVAAQQFDQAAHIAKLEADMAFDSKSYSRALHYYEIALKQFDQADLQQAKRQIQFQLGLTHYRLKQFGESIDQFQGLLREEAADSLHNLALYEIGKNYYWQGELYKAETYYKRHIDGLIHSDDKHNLINKYFALIRVYNEILTPNSQTKLKGILDQLRQLQGQIEFTPIQELAFNNYCANYYNHPATYDFEKAKGYYEKNISLAEVSNQKGFLCAAWNNLADLYNEAHRDGALNYLQFSLKECLGSSAYYTYHHTSFAYLNQLKFDQALEYIEKSLDALVPNKSGNTTLDFVNTPNKTNFLLSLERKAEIYIKRYAVLGDTTDLEKALSELELIDTYIDLIESGASEERSQLHWRRTASIGYARAIYCAGILGRNDLVFYFNEKSKALLLTDAVLKHGIRPEIPVALSIQEMRLRSSILQLESQSLQRELNQEESSTLFSSKLRLEQIADTISQLYPEYTSSNSKAQLVPLDEVINTLDSNKVVLSYNWHTSAENENYIHLLSITHQGSSYHKIPLNKAVTSLLDNHQRQVRKPWVTPEDQQRYQRQAAELFDILFPEKVKSQIKDKNLIIIPDGPLQYLAFEPLVQSATQRFLIEDHRISYAYSLSFLKHSTQQTRAASSAYAGFAPVYFQRIGQDSLPHSEEEVRQIQKQFAGTIFAGDAATKENFTTYGNQSRLLHLATHAKTAGSPRISFHDSDLELFELYTSRNQAELVVLSACETSIGEIAEGEGTMSLKRGFLYAGANAVISSLWNVNDKSTAMLMQDFYKELARGSAKDEALQRAKVNYLNAHSLSERSPYYWASFVMVGNTAAIDVFPNRSRLWIWGVLILVLAIPFIYFMKKKMKKVG